MKKHIQRATPLLIIMLLLISACGSGQETAVHATTLGNIPAFSGEPYVEVNNNQPFFTEEELTSEVFETYSTLDDLGRCGVAYANICQELMPTEARGSIGQVKPSGWQMIKYDFVDGKYLYNRCHLIGFQLAGENANEQNLITGTRYLNVDGMLPFENMIANYVDDTGNHVLYRVTPLYEGDNLVASGVLMEAQSIEDDGILFNVYCYNNMPGVEIDYATGLSSLSGEPAVPEPTPTNAIGGAATYVLNTNSRKFHATTCASVTEMKPQNREDYAGTRDQLVTQGYEPCGRCKP